MRLKPETEAVWAWGGAGQGGGREPAHEEQLRGRGGGSEQTTGQTCTRTASREPASPTSRPSSQVPGE